MFVWSHRPTETDCRRANLVKVLLPKEYRSFILVKQFDREMLLYYLLLFKGRKVSVLFFGAKRFLNIMSRLYPLGLQISPLLLILSEPTTL